VLEILINNFNNIKYYYFFLLILFIFTPYLFSYFIKKKILKNYISIQRSHNDEIARFGGLIIFLFIFFLNLFELKIKFINQILISSLPLIIVSLKEDIFQNTTTLLRMTCMILTIFIFFNLNKTNFPQIDFLIIKDILNIYVLAFLFFSFSVLVIINGMNFIDGLNGLFTLNLICQLFAMFYLSIVFKDFEYQIIISSMIITMFIFLLFNLPFGKIFLGDLGAYFLALLMSMLIINFFGKYTEILSWNAILILFYPAFELLFSFIRKIYFEKKNPMESDHKHLHSLMYRYFLKKSKNKQYSNNISSILLFVFWSSPLLVFFTYKRIDLIISVILFLIIIYISTYIFFLSKLKK
jgi:UDP-N-acetylmuramyl pentapeptide phosphotransferase/UDP-N-acetylglucosamine-1-phosphate transferase